MTQQVFKKAWVDRDGDVWTDEPFYSDDVEYWLVPVGSYVVTPDEMPEVEPGPDGAFRVGGYFYHEGDAVHARSGVLRFAALLTFLDAQPQDPDAEVLAAIGDVVGREYVLARLREAGYDIVKKEAAA